jgi:hypothetical protein
MEPDPDARPRFGLHSQSILAAERWSHRYSRRVEEENLTESSPELTIRVANFMSRAEEILDHPLAGTVSTVRLTLKVDTKTGQVVRADLDNNLLDKASWGYLATLLRPLIFLRNDQGSVGRLMNLINRDHPRLRESGLDKIQKGLNDWRTQPIIGVQDLGPIEQAESMPEGSVTRVWSGPPGTLPDDVAWSQLTADYKFAALYFNGRLWHADSDKVNAFDKATREIQAVMAKCAEVRTLSAVQWVRHLHQWILDARAAGWPL